MLAFEKMNSVKEIWVNIYSKQEIQNNTQQIVGLL